MFIKDANCIVPADIFLLSLEECPGAEVILRVSNVQPSLYGKCRI